jgi:hypothetical protein
MLAANDKSIAGAWPPIEQALDALSKNVKALNERLDSQPKFGSPSC